MIRHYLTIVHQAAVLEQRLVGRTLAECWSQQKNELLLRFIEGTDSLFVEISLDLRIGYALVRNEVHRARRNTIDFFESALGSRVSGVEVDDGERVIRIHLAGGFDLLLFFFGAGSGNAILLHGGGVAEAFHRDVGAHETMLAGGLSHEPQTRQSIVHTMRASDSPAAKALMRAIPMLGRRLADEAFVRSGIDAERDAGDLSDEELSRILDTVDRLYAECESSGTFTLYFTSEELVFALTRLQSLEARAEQVRTFEDIAEAVRVFRSSYYRRRTLDSTRSAMNRSLTTELNRLQRLLEKQRASAAHGARAAEYEESGSLLLSNLHAIDRGASSATVTDYSGAERVLALDPKLTPAQNADRFFARARKAREAASRAELQQGLTARRLQQVEKLLARVSASSTLQELEELERDNPEILRMEREPRESGSSDRYRRFTVVGGLEVYAGKSAANNDELTVRFARPNDYWFHARGSSGSHVVLRWGDAKSKPPKEAIRAAASIAAYYSGAKNAKMVPVAYTLKKHVRKPRGSEVGAVVMEREEVIMVEPKLPDG